MPGEPKLIEFLIALAHSTELMNRFNDPKQRDDLLREWGLSGHSALAQDATLADVQKAVNMESEGADVAWWIRLAQGPDPDTWIVDSVEEKGTDGGGDAPTGGEAA
jgi:hypothetical protein